MVDGGGATTSRALDLLGDCAGAPSRAQFAAVALPRLHRLFGCDEVSLADVSPTMRRTHRATGYPTPPQEVPQAVHTLQTRLAEHPWCSAHLGGTIGAAARLTDVVSQPELRRTPFYADFYRPRGLAFADYGAISHAGDHLVVIGLGRRRRDFTDDEHRLFERLRGPLGGLWWAAQAREASGYREADRLTEAERRVAGLVRAGLSNRAVADRLGVSVKAVEQHLTRIYRRLGVRSRVQLALALGPPA